MAKAQLKPTVHLKQSLNDPEADGSQFPRSFKRCLGGLQPEAKSLESSEAWGVTLVTRLPLFPSPCAWSSPLSSIPLREGFVHMEGSLNDTLCSINPRQKYRYYPH